MISSV